MSTTPNPDADKKSKIREAASLAFSVVGVVLVVYVVYYWGFWRGGKYLYAEIVAPYFASASNPSSGTPPPSSSPSAVMEMLKLLWAVVGATLGAVAAALVRRWYVFHALEGKVVLLDKVRVNLLKEVDRGAIDDPVAIAIGAGTVKYLFGEKEYINIGKYVEPTVALMLLRTISAIDMLSSIARLPQGEAELVRVSGPAIRELRQFNLDEVLLNLKLLRSDGTQAVGDAADKAAG